MSRDILLALIDADPEQPRKHFDTTQLDELAQSMAANGLAVPILLRPAGERYTIVHGERRYRAAQSLGWETIAADVRDIAPDEAPWLALIENIQRADLSPIEEARAYRARLDTGITQQALGERIGKSQSYIAQKLRLLTLSTPLMLYLDHGALTEGHTRQLLRLKGIYGEEVTETFEPGALGDIDRKILPNDDTQVMFFTLALRPMAQPAGGFLPRDKEHSEILYDGCKAFCRYVAEAGYTIPLWELAAYWWATYAIHFTISVADLRVLIDNWQHMVYSALAIGSQREKAPPSKVPGKPTPQEELAQLEYWGYWEDLRHMRLLDRVRSDQISSLKVKALQFIMQEGSYALPSALQPGGTKFERYNQLAQYVT